MWITRRYQSPIAASSLLARSSTVVQYYHGGFDNTSPQTVNTAYAAAVPKFIRTHKALWPEIYMTNARLKASYIVDVLKSRVYNSSIIEMEIERKQ